MAGRRLAIVVGAGAGLVLPWLAVASPAGAAGAGHPGCSAGAHTLAAPGSVLYPETGNGGYTSLHTFVHLVYNASSNTFLPGNDVELTDRATQCLTSFSLDFERRSPDPGGPDMTVRSVLVNGRPARFTFVQPTYPGDPNGPNDPAPAAHEASESNPAGGPVNNPLPPACTPELPNTNATADSMDGTPCPANKLVITPSAVTAGRTAVANGGLVFAQHHGPSREFPGGSVTWYWHAGMPIASYLVEDSVGNYSLTSRVIDGIRFYQAQDTSISAAQRDKNLAIMNMQPDITAFESQFNGSFPFASDGIIIGTPDASFDEEMEGMIAFSGGVIDTDTLYHENMHQWWGDNVSEGGYHMTFFKEGLATLAEFLYAARLAENAAGGPATAAGRAAFQASLVKQFAAIYGSGKDFWTTAPSNPIPYSLFNTSNTYDRPGAAYIALRQILGPARFDAALRQLQRLHGGASVSEAQLEAVFGQWLPVHSSGCEARLGQFFAQWFDAAYPAGGGTNRPMITGPGLAGPGFYSAPGTCA
jgi:Peptidase family M1 domain